MLFFTTANVWLFLLLTSEGERPSLSSPYCEFWVSYKKWHNKSQQATACTATVTWGETWGETSLRTHQSCRMEQLLLHQVSQKQLRVLDAFKLKLILLDVFFMEACSNCIPQVPKVLRNRLIVASLLAAHSCHVAGMCEGGKALLAPAAMDEEERAVSLKHWNGTGGRFQRNLKKTGIQFSGNASGPDFTYFCTESKLMLQPAQLL